MNTILNEIKDMYFKKKDSIISRLKEFSEVFKKDDNEIFGELAFCLLTPQSKAKICHKSILSLKENGLLYSGSSEQILSSLIGIRFKERKSVYIVKARDFFSENGEIKIKPKFKDFSNNYEIREWLVKNIKGMGYKEASHFLRNIGMGEDIAILDRHILKNLNLLNIIEDIPKSLTKKRYFEIENKMRKFSQYIKIPMSHLDILFWSKETGEIFK